MIVKILVTVLILFTHTLGQGIIKKSNTLYLELGGNCVWYSINYEKEVVSNFSPRIGIAIMPISEFSNSGKRSDSKIFATIIANYFADLNENNKIELGGGLAYGLGEIFPTTTVGYRYSPKDGGMIFKLTFTPLLDQKLFSVFPWFGVGFGIKF